MGDAGAAQVNHPKKRSSAAQAPRRSLPREVDVHDESQMMAAHVVHDAPHDPGSLVGLARRAVPAKVIALANACDVGAPRTRRQKSDLPVEGCCVPASPSAAAA